MYEGAFEISSYHGHGAYVYADGSMYVGDFVMGKKHGRGKFDYEGISVDERPLMGALTVEGQFEEGKLQGKAIVSWADGSTFEGHWLDGEDVGEGIYTDATGAHRRRLADLWSPPAENETFETEITFPDGSTYKGGIKRGSEYQIFDGHGRRAFPNGEVYEGEYKDGQRHGRGRYAYADGQVYDGYFRNNVKEGHGILWDAAGYYDGEWKGGNKSKGKMTFKDGSWFDGEWVNDSPEGWGMVREASGIIYEGGMKRGRYEGTGRMTLVDGTIYEGIWIDGITDNMLGTITPPPGNKKSKRRRSKGKSATLSPPPSKK